MLTSPPAPSALPAYFLRGLLPSRYDTVWYGMVRSGQGRQSTEEDYHSGSGQRYQHHQHHHRLRNHRRRRLAPFGSTTARPGTAAARGRLWFKPFPTGPRPSGKQAQPRPWHEGSRLGAGAVASLQPAGTDVPTADPYIVATIPSPGTSAFPVGVVVVAVLDDVFSATGRAYGVPGRRYCYGYRSRQGRS